ncbi:hypothetical protein APR08_004589 [Nocardia amikacinitolerans]|nr:hypothetical protein [Nocardia amikacinitolerans]
MRVRWATGTCIRCGRRTIAPIRSGSCSVSRREWGVAAIVVPGLAHVDDRPARICEDFDLETVCPPSTWARVGPPARPGPVPDEEILREVLARLSESATASRSSRE